MQYMGGKSRIARPIAEQIQSGKVFVSLFCGTCSVESKVAPFFEKVICSDNHKYLIAMLNAVKHGYNLPDDISEQEYKYIREHKDNDPALSGFVGFGCSFGGRWFEGYARNKTGTNYCLQSKKSLLKDMQNLSKAEFICDDYRNIEIPTGSIVYADPPYQGTKKYSSEKFDTTTFWDYMSNISKTNKVFISEQTAPEEFVCIWQKSVTRTLDKNKSNQFKVVEKLFIHRNWI